MIIPFVGHVHNYQVQHICCVISGIFQKQTSETSLAQLTVTANPKKKAATDFLPHTFEACFPVLILVEAKNIFGTS